MRITTTHVLITLAVLALICLMYVYHNSKQQLEETDKPLEFTQALTKLALKLDLTDRIKEAEAAENYEQAAELKKELDKLKEE